MQSTQGINVKAALIFPLWLVCVTTLLADKTAADELSLIDLSFTQTYANSAMQATELPGESISLLDRRVDWNVSDLRLDGTGPRIDVTRRNAVRSYGWYDNWRRDLYNWELNIPRVELHLWIHNEDLSLEDMFRGCGNGNVKNLDVKINDVGDFRAIAKNPDISYPEGVHTHFNNNWLIKCAQQVTTRSMSTGVSGVALPSTVNNAIILLSPEGETYYFAYQATEHQVLPPQPPKNSGSTAWYEWSRLTRQIVSFYVTDIEDRFGNFITYHYEQRPDNNNGNVMRVQKITASDGREVNFTYQVDNHGQTGVPGSGRHLKQVSAGSQKVEYAYTTGNQGQPLLHKVTYSDELSWQYSYHPFNNFDLLHKVQTPWGSSVTYDYAASQNVPNSCGDLRFSSTPGASKRIVDTGEIQFTYEYNSQGGSIGTLPMLITEVTEPEAKKRFYHACYNIFNTALSHPDRAKQYTLVRQQVYGGTNNDVLLRTIDTDWGTTLYTGDFKRQRQGEDYRSYLRLFKIKESISQSGDTYTTEYSQFDNLGLSQVTREYNSAVTGKRYIRTGYYHDNQNWLLSQPTTTELSADSSTWTLLRKQTYYASSHSYKSLPYQQYHFGQLQRTNISYHSDGHLKLQTFNVANRWVQYEDYKRGKPQLIKQPQRYTATCTDPVSCFISASQSVNDDGNVSQVTDFNGNSTNYQYDALGRITHITPQDPGWSPTVISYPLDNGRLTRQISRGNYRKTINYDGLLRPVLSREWDNSNTAETSRYTVQRFNAYNKPTFTSYASTSSTESQGTAFEYDGLQRLTRQYSTVDNNGVDYAYLANNKVRNADARGNITTTTYRAFGSPSQELPTQIDQPEGVASTLSYNLFDNITAITQGGIIESRLYDGQQRLCRLVRPDVGHTAYSYNALGQPVWIAQGASGGATACNAGSVTAAQKVSYSYDNLGAQRTITYPDSTPTKSYTFDNQGNLTALVAGTAVWDYTYNSSNLMETEILTLDNISRITDLSYNAMGHVSSVTYPSGKTISYAPNALGQATRAGNYATGATYFPNGQLKDFTYGNGLTFSQTLDTQQRPEYQTVKRSNINVLNHRYQYDANHNIDRISDLVTPAKTISLSYDGLDRLDTAAGFWGNGSFSYDALGNITQKTLGNQSLTYAYNTNNRLTGISGSINRSYGYDSRGNITNNSQRAFSFNLANQLISSGTNSYQYDGYNRRVKKTSNGKTQYSLYNAAGQLIMTDGDKGPTEYFYLGSKLIAKESQVPTSEDTPGYTGHLEDDDLQLTYMQQRYYDPVIGRFYSNDPVDMLGHMQRGNPTMGFNRYAYANNNPYKYTDPDGEFLQVIGMIIGGFTAYQEVKNNSSLSSESKILAVAIGAATGALTGGLASAGVAKVGIQQGVKMAAQMSTKDTAKAVLTSSATGAAAGATSSATTQLTTEGAVDGGKVAVDSAKGALGGVVAATGPIALGNTVAGQAVGMVAEAAVMAATDPEEKK